MAAFSDETIDKIIEDEVGIVFMKVLEHAGVYKRTPEGKEAFRRFVASVKISQERDGDGACHPRFSVVSVKRYGDLYRYSIQVGVK